MTDSRLSHNPGAIGRLIEREAGKVLILTPVEAGRNDPPMQDWLALPASDDLCPECGGERWGTMNATGYFLVRVCHTHGCGAKFRGEVTPFMVHNVVSALVGESVRLAR